MLFSSITFLYYFLAGVLLLYFVLPAKCRNAVLFVSSLVFYGWGEPRCLFLMLGTITLGWLTGLGIEKHRGKPAARALVLFSVVVNLAALGYFKYAGFFLENFRMLTGLSVPVLRIALPIGISFYTFQILSYTVDVCRGDVKAQRNFLLLGTYITLFPQLIAGPIVRYSDVETQLTDRVCTLEKTALGIRRLVLGLGKKILIANPLGELCTLYTAAGVPSVLFSWLYAVGFALQIYFDFSGYSDMAIGLGKIFGFELTENFNYPFISRSITEFWRRWHISLGSWFRDYVYIPLGGNRVSRVRHFFNILAVWALTGFWHGAAWNFALWGIYFAVLLLIEKYFLMQGLKRIGPAAHLYVLFFVIISFVIFDSANLSSVGTRIAQLFGAGALPAVSAESLYALRSYFLLLCAAVIGATPLPGLAVKKLRQSPVGERAAALLEPVLLVVILLLVTAHLVDGSFNPFLYFRF